MDAAHCSPAFWYSGLCNEVEADDIETCLEEVHIKSDMPCCDIVHEICVLTIEQYNLPNPMALEDMYELYLFLRTSINNELTLVEN